MKWLKYQHLGGVVKTSPPGLFLFWSLGLAEDECSETLLKRSGAARRGCLSPDRGAAQWQVVLQARHRGKGAEHRGWGACQQGEHSWLWLQIPGLGNAEAPRAGVSVPSPRATKQQVGVRSGWAFLSSALPLRGLKQLLLSFDASVSLLVFPCLTWRKYYS